MGLVRILGLALLLLFGTGVAARHWHDNDARAAFRKQFGSDVPDGVWVDGFSQFKSGACALSVYSIRGSRQSMELLRVRFGMSDRTEKAEIEWIVAQVERETTFQNRGWGEMQGSKYDGPREDLHILVDEAGASGVLISVYWF